MLALVPFAIYGDIGPQYGLVDVGRLVSNFWHHVLLQLHVVHYPIDVIVIVIVIVIVVF